MSSVWVNNNAPDRLPLNLREERVNVPLVVETTSLGRDNEWEGRSGIVMEKNIEGKRNENPLGGKETTTTATHLISSHF
jgi:hypothetical protein